MSYSTFLPYLLVMSLVTYLIRMLPLTLIRGRIKNSFVQSFLYYVPYAVLGSMTFPAIFESTGNLFSAIMGTVVALILGFMGKGLLTVAVSASLVAYLTGMLI